MEYPLTWFKVFFGLLTKQDSKKKVGEVWVAFFAVLKSKGQNYVLRNWVVVSNIFCVHP